MNPALGFARHTGLRLAEVGFLLILFAGQFKFATGRTIVASLFVQASA